MVCAVKQKPCAARDRTKLTYYQLIVIDRIMIENVVLFKILRVVYEIVVKRKIPDYDIRIGDNVFQIYNLLILAARIYLFTVRNSHVIISLIVYFVKTIPVDTMQSFILRTLHL